MDMLDINGAIFSPSRLYRYGLWRLWDMSKNYCMFIGLNPSTADEVENDPTVRRCINYARRWGYGGLVMTNIFAWRATDPKAMMKVDDPVGPENDIWLKEYASDAGLVVAAWGNHGLHINRAKDVIEKVLYDVELICLDKTMIDMPKHPLYIKADIKPQLLRKASV